MGLKISIPVILLVCLTAYADQVFNKGFLGKARGKNWSEAYNVVRRTTILTDNAAQNHFIEYDAYCFKEAGIHYGISPVLLKAISDVESNGNIFAVNYNRSSKTIDIGHFQINSFWRQHLGENYEKLFNACYCTMVGAWILKQCIGRYGYNWDAVACYHTGHGISDAKSILKRRNGIAYIQKIKLKLSETDDH